jgi:hypothetical protein
MHAVMLAASSQPASQPASQAGMPAWHAWYKDLPHHTRPDTHFMLPLNTWYSREYSHASFLPSTAIRDLIDLIVAAGDIKRGRYAYIGYKKWGLPAEVVIRSSLCVIYDLLVA